MTNRFYNNTTNKIIAFTRADNTDVENKFDDVAAAFEAVADEVDAIDDDFDSREVRTLRHATESLDALTESAAARADKVISFNSSGGLALRELLDTETILYTASVVTAATATLTANRVYFCKPSEDSTYDLPATPATGDVVGFSFNSDPLTYTLTIDGNGNDVEGESTMVVDVPYAQFSLIYDGSQWSL
jgi:hypothetical protein